MATRQGGSPEHGEPWRHDAQQDGRDGADWDEEHGDTVRRPAEGRTGQSRATAYGDLGYGDAGAMSYPGSSSPVPTGEHRVAGGWGDDEVDVETTTGTYAVQEPDGGYDGYAAVGAGAYRSGGIDPYRGRPVDPGTATWQQPLEAGAAPQGSAQPHAGGPRGSFGHSQPHWSGGPSGAPGPGGTAGASGYGPGGYGRGPGGPGPYGSPGGPGGRGRGPVVAVLALVAVIVVALAAFGISRLVGGDDTADDGGPGTSDRPPTTPSPSTEPPTDDPSDPPSTTPPPAGTEGSAGGDGDVSGLAYLVDTSGNDLGAGVDGAFPQDGQYTSTLRVIERVPVVVAGYSPDYTTLSITIEGNGVNHELTDSADVFDFLDFSGFPSSLDPAGAFVLEPGDYELVVTSDYGDPSAFELEVVAGDGTTLADGDQLDVDVQPDDAILYAVDLEADQELTVTLTGEDTDPLLMIASPDGTITENDDWESSTSYDGEDLPDWLDSGLTVSGDEGEHVVIVTTFGGQGGRMVADATIG
ncbi:hypothetical protein [Georgenia sp. Z1491]|uniref:hypothetical protein n=1 Tax=Georgenia sp. Z1491 TaxID=3416707 RepID=UPI003CF18AC9